MKIHSILYVVLLFVYLFFVQSVKAENIHFNNEIYVLKSSQYSDINKGYENEYFTQNGTKNDWQNMIGIYYYPEIKNPIKFAENADKEIETKYSVLLLKFIANKKQDKAVLSFIDSGDLDGKTYIEHNIYKYEPHPQKGMMILRYAKRYVVQTNDDAAKYAKEIKDTNDDLMEQLIISSIPPIVEEDID